LWSSLFTNVKALKHAPTQKVVSYIVLPSILNLKRKCDDFQVKIQLFEPKVLVGIKIT
jgi:hypothetical protein